MMTEQLLSALEATIRSTRLTLQSEIREDRRSGTEVVACMELLPSWSKDGPEGDGEHPLNEACTKEGQPWRCCQAHNSHNNPDIVPGQSPAHWVQYHTKDPSRALPFAHPTGAHDTYQIGECMLFTDGAVYRSTIDNNAYGPDEHADGWEKIRG